MAEGDAERAFFQAQAKNAEAEAAEYNKVEGQEADSSGSDDYDPLNPPRDEYSTSLADLNQNNEDKSDSRPVQSPPQTDESQPQPAAPTQQPKSELVGDPEVQDGNKKVDGDDDDDQNDAEYEPPGVLDVENVNTTTSVNIPPQTFAGNSNQSSSTPDVSLQGVEQDSASQDNDPNSSYPSSVTASKNDVVPLVSAQAPYTSQPALGTENGLPESPSSAAASRGRLPHDHVGILEDRVKEDPRGDIPAWLELIHEHTSRNKFDNARDVFERFLKVFPSAVSIFDS